MSQDHRILKRGNLRFNSVRTIQPASHTNVLALIEGCLKSSVWRIEKFFRDVSEVYLLVQ